jgi:hypothetical protein
MSIFYSDYLTIKKSKKNYEYSCLIDIDNKKNKLLWENVLPRYIKVLKKNEKSNDKELIISANKICTLSEFITKNKLEYHNALNLCNNISTQIFLLKKYHFGITHFDINDIIVIDDGMKFLFINPHKIEKVKFGKVKINKIIKKTKLCSPEICHLESLPSKIHYKSSLYSLALLVIYCLTKKYIDSDDTLKNIDYIYGTKLYWSLERCLQKKPSNRFFYII